MKSYMANQHVANARNVPWVQKLMQKSTYVCVGINAMGAAMLYARQHNHACLLTPDA